MLTYYFLYYKKLYYENVIDSNVHNCECKPI